MKVEVVDGVEVVEEANFIEADAAETVLEVDVADTVLVVDMAETIFVVDEVVVIAELTLAWECEMIRMTSIHRACSIQQDNIHNY